MDVENNIFEGSYLQLDIKYPNHQKLRMHEHMTHQMHMFIQDITTLSPTPTP